LIGKNISHYTIHEKIGEGGMGIVYRAVDNRLLRDVVLKILPLHFAGDEKRLKRFTREAQAASALNHPNICIVHDVGSEDEIRYIVMEFVEGKTLRQILEEKESLPENEVIEIALQICDALKAAHAKGIIHRDLKPENIMVTNNGTVKVMDFGLAKLKNSEFESEMSNADQSSDLLKNSLKTSLSTLQGTASYMAPEQINKRDVDERTDIFSLGIVLYELLTGKNPFVGNSNIAKMKSILKDEPKLVILMNPALSKPISSIVQKALSKEPAKRYKNAQQLNMVLLKQKDSFVENQKRNQGKKIALVFGFLFMLFILYEFYSYLSGANRTGMNTNRISLNFSQPLQGSLNLLHKPVLTHDEKYIIISDPLTDVGQDSICFWKKEINSRKRKRFFSISSDRLSGLGIVGDISNNDNQFVFSLSAVNSGGIYLFDKNNKKVNKILDFGIDPIFSPSNDKLVFATMNAGNIGEKSSIYIYDFNTKTTEKVSPKNDLSYISPGWFSDDNKILCVAGKGSTWEMWVIEIDSKESYQLSSFNTWIKSPVYSDKLNAIFFISTDPGLLDLCYVSLSQKEIRIDRESVQFTNNKSYNHLSILPSGESLLLNELISTISLQRMPLSDYSKYPWNEGQTLLNNFIPINDIDISPDGSNLILESPLQDKRALIRVSTTTGLDTVIYDKTNAFSPAFSADGQWIAFDAGGGDNADIYRVSVNGGKTEEIIDHPGADWMPTYSPDGKYLCFVSNRSGQYDLWLHDLNTKEEIQITNTPGTESRGFWSQDGKFIAFYQNHEKDSTASIQVFSMEKKHFETIRHFTKNELKKVPNSKVNMLTRLAWNPNSDKIYFTPWNYFPFKEIDVKTKKEKNVYDSNFVKPEKINLFVIHAKYVYFVEGTTLQNTYIAEIIKEN